MTSENIFYSVFQWIIERRTEVIATLTALIYLYYSIKQDKLLWIFGFISSLLYVYICFINQIYADMGINVYYVIVSIYGWFHWTYKKNSQSKEICVTTTTTKQGFVILVITFALYFLISIILTNFTDSNISHIDAFTTAASITATWMLARKMLEHWLIWIVVDAVSVGLYIYKGLYPTSGLYFIYTVMAAIGFIQWKKEIAKQESI